MKCFDNPLKFEECSLYMAGHSEASCEMAFDETLYKVVSVISGKATIVSGKEKAVLESGDSFFGFPHETFVVEGDAQYNFALFNVIQGKYSEAFGRVRVGGIEIAQRVFKSENLAITLGGLCKEISSGMNFFATELVSLFCSQMMVYLLRSFDAVVSDKSSGDDVNFKVCSQIMNYIDSRIYTMKNLREVASAMGYNYSYISTLFHKTCGITLNTYFKNKRMNEAKTLLSGSKMSISEIARIMNYSSVYAFSKAFKEHFGSSPGHYSGRF